MKHSWLKLQPSPQGLVGEEDLSSAQETPKLASIDRRLAAYASTRRLRRHFNGIGSSPIKIAVVSLLMRSSQSASADPSVIRHDKEERRWGSKSKSGAGGSGTDIPRLDMQESCAKFHSLWFPRRAQPHLSRQRSKGMNGFVWQGCSIFFLIDLSFV